MGPGAGEVTRIRREWHEWEQQFLPKKPPAGTPNREAIRKASAAEAKRISELPENEATRKEFRRRIEAAKRTACGQGDEIETWRLARIEKSKAIWQLLQWGFVVVRNHGGSVYLSRGALKVRVSDHAVPETEERAKRKSWCRSHRQLIVGVGTRRKAIAKWLTSIALESGRVAVEGET